VRFPTLLDRRLAPLRRAAPMAVLTVAFASAPASSSGQGPGTCSYTQRADVPAAMRDGTILRSNVFTPRRPGRFPVIVMRLPYNKDVAQTYVYASPAFYAAHCYVVVVQDVRGQYRSEGFFYTFRNEATDGYDTVEWAARLPKSNGRVGMYGFSYPGTTQYQTAILRPPHLKAIVPAMSSDDYHDGWTYEGGALDLSFAEDWPLTTIANSAVRGRYPDGPALDASMNHAVAQEFTKWYRYLPLKSFPPLRPNDPRVAPYFFDWLKHPNNDAYWRRWSIRGRYRKITVPALNFDGWYDIFINGALQNFNGMRMHGGSRAARDGTRLVVGPWLHIPWAQTVGQINFGPEAANPIDQLQLRWFDFWLKRIRNGMDKTPRVRIFVMGANRWRTADTWPLKGTRYVRYYLHSAGHANTASGDGSLSTTRRTRAEAPTDRYTYRPADPVPSLGGRFQASVPGGPFDQRPILGRRDILVFTTPPLRRKLAVIGPITATLYASSSARDTDWTAKLDDVDRHGRSMLIEYGIQRARYRNSETHPTLIQPGRIYKYTIRIWPTANLFKAGHRIRLEISSSNFPMYDRNPNTGHRFAEDAALKVARQTVYHDAAHASRILVPIAP
jgi:uncharacterized protein